MAPLPPHHKRRVDLLRVAADALVGRAGGAAGRLAIDNAHLLGELSAALLHQLIRAAAFVLVIVQSMSPRPSWSPCQSTTTPVRLTVLVSILLLLAQPQRLDLCRGAG
jgi:hypothetical protein